MIRFRQALPADADALTALMLASRAYDGAYRKIIEGYPVTAGLIALGITRIAEDERGLAGFYRIDTGNVELDLMFVADDRQGSGVGRLIFDDMAEQARAVGLTSIRIIAHPPAVEFYRHMSARDIGIVPPSGRIAWSRPELLFDLA